MPDHYDIKQLHPWDAMEKWMSPEQVIGFYRGNVIKYLARYDVKDGVADLRKAAVYLERLIAMYCK